MNQRTFTFTLTASLLVLPALYRMFHRHSDLKPEDFHEDHDHAPGEPCNEPKPAN